MRAVSTSACVLLVTLLVPPSARAQVADARGPEPEPVLSMAAAGVFGAVVGVGLGGFAGFAVARTSGCGHVPCLGLGVVLGASAGLSAGTPYAVHLANGRRGSYGWALLGSIGVTSVALALASASDSARPLYAIPLAQIVTSILIERGTM